VPRSTGVLFLEVEGEEEQDGRGALAIVADVGVQEELLRECIGVQHGVAVKEDDLSIFKGSYSDFGASEE
jgi:hypothetical protein